MRALYLALVLLLASGHSACLSGADASLGEALGPTSIDTTTPNAGRGRAYGAELDDASGLMPMTGLLGTPARAVAPGDAVAQAVSKAAPQPAGAPRDVVYTASLRLLVVSVDDALRSVQSFAEEAEGHLQSATSASITIRVPATRFDSTLERIAALGEVTDRSIDASDVTEQILELDIRLDNAKKTRERLLEHLGRSQKIGDTLKIEQELARVSETIEQIEGRLRFMRSQVALSTITVLFSARMPSQPTAALPLGLPFPWIEELGDGLVAGTVAPVTRQAGLFEFPPKLEPPADFLRYYASRDRVEALSADGLHIKLRRHGNPDQGTLAFWQKLARESLVRTRALTPTEERALDEQRTLLRGVRELGGRKLGYLLVLKRTSRQVVTFEAWGPAEVFDVRFEALVESARSS